MKTYRYAESPIAGLRLVERGTVAEHQRRRPLYGE